MDLFIYLFSVIEMTCKISVRNFGWTWSRFSFSRKTAPWS